MRKLLVATSILLLSSGMAWAQESAVCSAPGKANAPGCAKAGAATGQTMGHGDAAKPGISGASAATPGAGGDTGMGVGSSSQTTSKHEPDKGKK